MLVIISDLHLTDGTSGQTIKKNAFRIFTKRVRDMAWDASFRRNKPDENTDKPDENTDKPEKNTYQPVERVDILLLGDILDVIRSTSWLQKGSKARPWSDPSNRAFIKKVQDISDAILEHNEPSLDYLKDLSRHNGLTLPPSNDTGQQPNYDEDPLSVEVKIHYMVGNHDWFYHLPGASYDPLRKNVVEAIGLANDYKVGFPHDPEESPELAKVLCEHKVSARHGDIYDAFNFAEDRDESSLGDCIVVELLNRFPLEINGQMGAELPRPVSTVCANWTTSVP